VIDPENGFRVPTENQVVSGAHTLSVSDFSAHVVR
jgi:hypothetical protein